MNIVAHFETVIADKVKASLTNEFSKIDVFRFHVADENAIDKTTIRHIEVNAKQPTITRYPFPKYTCEVTVYVFIPNEVDGAVKELGELSAIVSEVLDSFVLQAPASEKGASLNAVNEIYVTKVEVSATGNDADLESSGRTENWAVTVNFLRLEKEEVEESKNLEV